MLIFKDQCGNTIELPRTPQHIVSLVPSQTELLSDLGLDDEVVGITRYCVHPTHWLASKAVIGGTKNFDLEKIAAISPDLIIGNKEENYREGIEQLQTKFPVWMSDIVTVNDAFEMIHAIGELTNRSYKSVQITQSIKRSFENIQKRKAASVLYLIWRKPWMAAAPGTFIHEMIDSIGLQNCLTQYSRYPELREDDIRTLQPDLILLSSEPFPFSEKHVEEISRISPSSKILLVDGEMFSWYGSRLLKAAEYFNNLPIER
jgi:ABC-type Fe3+-hydroxamate transport system substrate-binding protein